MNDRARELAEKYGISEADLHVLTSLPADPTTDSVPKATATAHAPGMLAVAVRDAGQRYEDLGLLGTGAMGEVRKVRDRELNRLMAMKIIRSRMMTRPKVVARFIEEAQATAQLTHPGIVPVHELGRLSDGRLYFTMQLITGQTLRSILKEVHKASSHGNWGSTDNGVSLRQLVAFFKQACDAIAYAHVRGVVHRDLKSENIMVGAYGEVQVVDWGLAKIWGEALADSLEEEPTEVVATHRSSQSALATQFGIVAGTPAYMPPEQARGDFSTLNARSDVYALGSTLYELVSGRPPYDGPDAQQVIKNILAGPPPPPGPVQHPNTVTMTRQKKDQQRGAASERPPIPSALMEVIERAMARDPADRYAHAGELAEVVGGWLQGLEKRRAARALCHEARQILRQAEQQTERAAHWEAEVGSDEPSRQGAAGLESRQQAWDIEDKAHEARRISAALTTKAQQVLITALGHDPELATAHRLLADMYRNEHLDAERRRDRDAASRWQVLLEAHDTGPHASYLIGDATFSIRTEPSSARVRLQRFDEQAKRLRAVPVSSIGRSPIEHTVVNHGSYLLSIEAEGCAPAAIPLFVEREAHESWSAPGTTEPGVIKLLTTDQLGVGECLVEAGWCIIGGDEQAVRSRPRARTWAERFIIQTHPVSAGDFVQFLDETRHGDAEERESLRDVLSTRGPTLPASGMSLRAAQAYASWLSDRTGQPWRLPTEVEWEKAARGVDGRFFPWGDSFDPGFCATIESFTTKPELQPFDRFEADTSVYGVRGMAGNIAEWTADRAGDEDGPQIIKGGHLEGPAIYARCASRGMQWPSSGRSFLGLRLVRSF